MVESKTPPKPEPQEQKMFRIDPPTSLEAYLKAGRTEDDATERIEACNFLLRQRKALIRVGWKSTNQERQELRRHYDILADPKRHAEQVESLDFIRYFHDLETEGDLNVSWGGGAIIEFKGEGFHDQPISNSITFTTSDMGGTITVPGTAMTGKFIWAFCGIDHLTANSKFISHFKFYLDTDEFRSEPAHKGKLSYTLPDFDTLMSVAGLQEDWFTAFNQVRFELKVDPGT